MDYASLINSRRRRFEELEAEMAGLGFFQNSRRSTEVMREHRQLTTMFGIWDELTSERAELDSTREMASGGEDEIVALAKEEILCIEARVAALEEKLRFAVLPPDPNEGRDAIVEIRAGTGGDEASLFAADLHRMYVRFAESRGWKVEVMDASPSAVRGFREVIFKVLGDEVFRYLKFESGVHRVQRVPSTETQGRVHTSTATVAVMPEADEVDLVIAPDDLRIEVCRAGGPGGQGVNTTDSAVQILHIPTGMIVRCQDGRSQLKNKEKALTVLRSRLLDLYRREEEEKYSAHRKSLIGSGGREEKIRTYNFSQNRITDHRIGLTLHELEDFLGGNLFGLVSELQRRELEEKFAEAQALTRS